MAKKSTPRPEAGDPPMIPPRHTFAFLASLDHRV